MSNFCLISRPFGTLSGFSCTLIASVGFVELENVRFLSAPTSIMTLRCGSTIFDHWSIRHLNQINNRYALRCEAVACARRGQKWHANCFIASNQEGGSLLVDDLTL